MSNPDEETFNSTSDTANSRAVKARGFIYKWTNFVYGWQKRYFELQDGVLVYYKSVADKQYGSRGSISLKSAQILECATDEYRFDVTTNSFSWYLRAETRKGRRMWLKTMKESMYDNRKDPRNSIGDSSVSTIDVGTSTRTLKLISMVDELQRYSDMIGRQTSRIEKLLNDNDDNAKTIMTSLLDEGLALNAVIVAVMQNLNASIDILHCKDAIIKKSAVPENDSQLMMDRKDGKVASHCTANESIVSDDEWHDAEDAVVTTVNGSLKTNVEDLSNGTMMISNIDLIDGEYSIKVSPCNFVCLPESYYLTKKIENVFMDQLKYAKAGVQDKVWQLFSDEGEMKMYRRELEIDGIVHDPLKATHLVQGVSAREFIHYFFEPKYKSEWDETLVSTRVVERVSLDTVIVHQLHKRVWPSAQRESLFWSHIRQINEHKSADALDLYMVCNNDCSRSDVSLENSSNVRVGLTVAMLCETVIKQSEKEIANLTRDDIFCRVCYCAEVHPGGWVPTSALRIIYRKEYPKFLRGFTKYVKNSVIEEPLIL